MPAQAVTSHQPISKSWWGSRQATGTAAGAAGSAEAGAAATERLDDGERVPTGGSAEAVAAATRGLDCGERTPTGGAVEAGAAGFRVKGRGYRI